MPAPSDGADQERSSGLLHVSVKAPDERAVGRAFSSAGDRAGAGQLPRLLHDRAARRRRSAFGVYWPALVPADEIDQVVVLDDGTRLAHRPGADRPAADRADRAAGVDAAPTVDRAGHAARPHFGARSGDKGGNANVGIWARDDAGYAWLAANLTVDRLRELLPEAADLEIRRYELPNLRALNFVLVGYLGEGVACSTAVRPPGQGPRRVPPLPAV